MSKNNSACFASPWVGGTNQIVSTGAVLLNGIVAYGSAAANILTVIGTANTGGSTSFIVGVGITSSFSVIFSKPIAYNNGLAVVNGGTAAFTVLYSSQ